MLTITTKPKSSAITNKSTFSPINKSIAKVIELSCMMQPKLKQQHQYPTRVKVVAVANVTQMEQL